MSSISAASSRSGVHIGRIRLAPIVVPSRYTESNSDIWGSVLERIRKFEVAAEELDRLLATTRAGKAGTFASVRGAVTGLAAGRASALRSTAEVNTSPSSFGPRAPAWTGGSTASPVVDGEYVGAQDDRFTFTVTFAGGQGSVATRIRVRNSAGQTTDTITISNKTAPGAEFTLSSGLVVRFEPGSFEVDDTFAVDVRAAVPTSADPDQPMGGSGAEDAMLEHQLDVVDGAFTVNGVAIAVSTTDSINDVLARITASDAGVTAEWDAAAEGVVLRQKTDGPDGRITLADDTSGFLAAVKLTGAALEPGVQADAERPLSELAAFAGVQAGTLTVNGRSIAFDPAVDSLLDVLARIEEAEAGVSTSFVGDRVLLRSDVKGAELSLSDGGTGFFDALGIGQGVVTAMKGTRGVSSSIARRMADAMATVQQSLNEIFAAGAGSESVVAVIGEFRGAVEGVLKRGFEASTATGVVRTRIGLAFDLGRTSSEVFDVSATTKRAFARAVGRRFSEVTATLGDGRQEPGVLDHLRAEVDRLRTRAETRIDISL